MQHSQSPAWLIAVLVSSSAAIGCGSDGPGPGPPPIFNTVSFAGAGDIAICDTSGPHATARLLDNVDGLVFTTGDNAYPNGTAANYRDCYDPSWGRHKERTRPVPGNHEYDVPNAPGYFGYFGPIVGSPAKSYYTFTHGHWKAYALNSNVAVDRASPQIQWLRAELAAQSPACVVAYWHHPLYSSGPHGSNANMREFWNALYEAGADLVLNGHDHLYERFGPQTPTGQVDSTRGIRQFTIGTGGSAEISRAGVRAAHSERVISETGILKLSLEPTAYTWEFIGIDGTVRDSGRQSCH